jgi:hypothetical protein
MLSIFAPPQPYRLILHVMSTAGAAPGRFRPALTAVIDMIAAADVAAVRADPKI